MYYKVCFLSVITIYDILFLLNFLQFFVLVITTF